MSEPADLCRRFVEAFLSLPRELQEGVVDELAFHSPANALALRLRAFIEDSEYLQGAANESTELARHALSTARRHAEQARRGLRTNGDVLRLVRQVIDLHEQEGVPFAEACRRLNTSYGNFKRQRARYRKQGLLP